MRRQAGQLSRQVTACLRHTADDRCSKARSTDADRRHMEGPFGEWTGHYAGGASLATVLDIKAIYHRKRPDPPRRAADGWRTR